MCKLKIWSCKHLNCKCFHPLPYQVVNAQQQGFDAAGGVGVSGSADGQEAPQELWQEL